MANLATQHNYRTALVTGATSGLGLAFADMLRKEGLDVWVTGRKLEQLSNQAGFHPVRLDLLNERSLTTALDQVSEETDGAPDVVINNAGAGVFAAFLHFPEDKMAEQFRLLLEAPIRIAHAFYPQMVKRCRGAIVNVASLAQALPIPCMSIYCAAKAGLSAFSRALMIETMVCNVQVVDLQPGDYRTRFNKATFRAGPETKWERRAWERFYKLVENGPLPHQAAEDLRKALRSGKSGVVKTGNFLHTRVGSAAYRILGESVLRRVIREYYHLK